MADELNIPTHRWYEPRNNISLPNSDFSKQWIYDSGIQKIDRWINSQPWGNPINALFALNEPGVWFDPSDLTTLFQDPAGTTPVTAPGNTVGLMLDKSKGLALGAELVANGDFATDTWWSKSGTTISGGTANWSAAADNSWLLRSAFLTANTVYRITWTITSVSSGGLRLHDGSIFSPTRSSPGTYTETFRATGTNFYVLSTGASTTASIDNISVRELAGNHATQAITAARPTYSIEPVGGRRNLLLQTEAFNEAVWAKSPTATVTLGQTDPLGGTTAVKVQFASIFQYHGQIYTFSGGETITHSVWLRGDTAGTITLADASGGVWGKQVTISTAWQRFDVTAASVPAGGRIVAVKTASGDLTTVYVAFEQLELGSTASPYQRVTTQYDVTEAGKPTMSYLYFDGVNDAMVTSTITPGIDKAQVFAGVRKLTDAAAGIIVESSGNVDANNGSIILFTNPSTYGTKLRGTTIPSSVNAPTSYAAPITNVVTGLGDIPADINTLRINGSQVAQGTADLGTGNFLAYPLNIGTRSGGSLPFTGHLYSLITRFGPNLDAPTISSTEIWVGDKTGIDVAKNISTTIYTRSGDTILDRANSTIERRAV